MTTPSKGRAVAAYAGIAFDRIGAPIQESRSPRVFLALVSSADWIGPPS